MTQRPPQIPEKPFQITLHGDTREDPFHWLRERDNPDVMAVLEAENAWTSSQLADTEQLQQTLYEAMRARIQEDDMSVPVRKGKYEYYLRTHAGKEYPSYWRRSDGQDECLLDVNLLADGHEFFEVGDVAVSPNHRFLALAVDKAGDEHYTLSVLDLQQQQWLDDAPGECAGELVWTMDSAGFYFTRLDDQCRPWQLVYHRLGGSENELKLCMEEPDQRFYMGIGRNVTDEMVLVTLASNTTSEIHYASALTGGVSFTCLKTRQQELEYYADFDGKQFWIRANDTGPGFRLVTAPADLPDQWQEVIPHQSGITLDDYEIFSEGLILFRRFASDGCVRMEVRPTNAPAYSVVFPDPVYSVGAFDNIHYECDVVRLGYESLTRPESVFELKITDGTQQLLKQKEVRGGYEPAEYLSRRIWAVSADGERVPVSVVGRKESFYQPSPLLLYGYGAYGESLDPWFSSGRLNLLDRGMMFAIAHVRGGGDLGEPWYLAGKMEHKENSFHDFIACAEALIQDGYTASDKLVITGGSAGGTLMGAVANMRPELFHAVAADVPFVDVINTLLDDSLPLTVTEYEEWGNPNEEEAYQRIRQWSPYDNIEQADYPHMLIQAAMNDSRVPYWEAAKWLARLRQNNKGSRQQLLHTRMDAGHGGASGRYQALHEAAFEQAFILKVMALDHL
ncbi:S9 family peptidase [Endozoicomonadaceae bacterium StTr2]